MAVSLYFHFSLNTYKFINTKKSDNMQSDAAEPAWNTFFLKWKKDY